MSLGNILESQAVILIVVAAIILLIIIVGAAKGSKDGKGCGWIIGLIIAGIIGYLLISSEIIKVT